MSYLKEKLRKFGWRRLPVVACRLLWERVYRRERYFLFKRAAGPCHVPKQAPLRAVPITAETAERYASTFPYRPAKFLHRLSGGVHGLFYLREDGTPLGYHWYVVGADYFEPAYGWTFHLGEREAYVLDGYVLPGHRGAPTTAQGFAHTLNAARECGAEAIFSLADQTNWASCKLHLHMGFDIAGCLELTRVFNRPMHTRPVDYRLHLSPEMMEAMNRSARRRTAPVLGRAATSLAGDSDSSRHGVWAPNSSEGVPVLHSSPGTDSKIPDERIAPSLTRSRSMTIKPDTAGKEVCDPRPAIRPGTA